MARYTGPKNRLSRREGFNLGLKNPLSKKVERRLNVPPGQHGHKGGRRKVSEYGHQLREKQKVKSMYGLMEKQFSKYFNMANKTRASTGETLLQILERRLDNVIYRLNFAPTRATARQMVGHGHVFVNGKKVNIPSYQIKINDVVNLDSKSSAIPEIKKLLEEKEFAIPAWLERQGAAGKIAALPKREDIDEAIHEQLIVEFYSR